MLTEVGAERRDCGLTIFVHLHIETLPESARLTLVTARHIHDARSVLLAHVVYVPADGSFEETTTPVAALDAIVLARRPVAAHVTERTLLGFCRCHSAFVGGVRMQSTIFGISPTLRAHFGICRFFLGGCCTSVKMFVFNWHVLISG